MLQQGQREDVVTHQGQSRVGGGICNAKTKFGPHNQEIPTACTVYQD